jgi:mevalonate pyrophosphate decarboxylase
MVIRTIKLGDDIKIISYVLKKLRKIANVTFTFDQNPAVLVSKLNEDLMQVKLYSYDEKIVKKVEG